MGDHGKLWEMRFLPVSCDILASRFGDYHRNSTAQKEAIQPIESAPTTISPQALSPQPHTVTPLIPLTYTSLDTLGNLAWPINLTPTSLDCGRKPEHPEETYADTGRMCKLHTDSHPSRESNPDHWSCEAAVLTTVPPCCSYRFNSKVIQKDNI